MISLFTIIGLSHAAIRKLSYAAHHHVQICTPPTYINLKEPNRSLPCSVYGSHNIEFHIDNRICIPKWNAKECTR